MESKSSVLPLALKMQQLVLISPLCKQCDTGRTRLTGARSGLFVRASQKRLTKFLVILSLELS